MSRRARSIRGGRPRWSFVGNGIAKVDELVAERRYEGVRPVSGRKGRRRGERGRQSRSSLPVQSAWFLTGGPYIAAGPLNPEATRKRMCVGIRGVHKRPAAVRRRKWAFASTPPLQSSSYATGWPVRRDIRAGRVYGRPIRQDATVLRLEIPAGFGGPRELVSIGDPHGLNLTDPSGLKTARIASTAGTNRRVMPTASVRPTRSAKSLSLTQAGHESASGFSQSTS